MQDSEDSQPNAPEHDGRRTDHGSHQAAAPCEMIEALRVTTDSAY